MIGVWRDGGGDTDAGPGARDGGSRAGAGPSELARQHDVPAAPVAAGVGARADLRAVAGALLRRRAPRRAHGRRRQGVRRHAAGRHAHRRPSRAEGVPRPRGPPGRPEDLHARPDAGGQGAGRGAPGDAPARHGGRPGADVGPRPAACRHRSRGARRRGVERVRRDREAGPQPEGQVTTGRVLSVASAWALAEAALRQAEAALRQRQAEVQQAIANVERDTAQLANARVQERRYKALVEKELVAREQYDQLQTNLAAMEATVQADRAAVENAKASERAAQANVDNARLQLGYTEIRAPIDGRTGNLLVQNGNVIKANDDSPLVVINQVHPIYVSFSVPEQHLADIKKYRARGPLRVEARLPRQLETIATGELTFVNNAVDQTTATIQLKATFPNTDNALWPGQFLDVVLTFTSRTAIVVPSQAIQPGQQGPFVFVVKPDATVESRPVAPGTRLGAETIIEQGLRAGERVVTDGQLRLVPGAKVEIRPPKTS